MKLVKLIFSIETYSKKIICVDDIINNKIIPLRTEYVGVKAFFEDFKLYANNHFNYITDFYFKTLNQQHYYIVRYLNKGKQVIICDRRGHFKLISFLYTIYNINGGNL